MLSKITQVQVNIGKNVLLVPYHQSQKEYIVSFFPWVYCRIVLQSLAKKSKKKEASINAEKVNLTSQPLSNRNFWNFVVFKSGQNEENIK